MLIGYARVSTADQNLDHQLDALRRAGVQDGALYFEHARGAGDRPQLALALRTLRPGDALVVTRLDRLGRSLAHLVEIGNELHGRGVDLRVIEQAIDTATPTGRLLFGVLATFAEFQRDLIRENTRDGLAAARARGRLGGRPPSLTPKQQGLAQRLYAAREMTVAQIAETFGVPRSTVYGYLKAGRKPAA